MKNQFKDAARRVLESNSMRHGPHYYFTADRKKYPFQYYWDSCAQAIVMSLFDPPRAEEEMYTLLSTQYVDGCMPYLTSWEKPPIIWNIFLHIANWSGKDGRAILSTQPMLSAVATWEIYKRTGNKSFLEKVIPELAREADYLGVQRDLLEDGLVVIVNALEAGTNESPVFDEIMGLPRPRGLGPTMHLLFYLKMAWHMAKYERVGYELERIADLELFLVEDVMNNSMFCCSMSAMGDILEEVGEARAASEYRKQADLLARRMESEFWDEADGFFYTRYGTHSSRSFSKVKTLSGVLPLYTGLASREKVSVLVETHLSSEEEFLSEFPFSFTSMDEPSWRPGIAPFPFPSLWRGGTYVLMNWMLFIGLAEYGYVDLARLVARKTEEMVKENGFREVFNSRTGKGYGAKNYGVTTLAVDMLERLESLDE